MSAVASTGKSAEYEGLNIVIAELGEALNELPGAELDNPLFTRVAAAWAEESTAKRRIGVAQDIALIHVASMSNLFAALGWSLIDLLTHPEEARRVGAGDQKLAEACALESIRLAQRSIMARYVLKPVTMDVGDALYEVGAGVTIATLLPLTNTSAAPGLDMWDPTRWNRRRLADGSAIDSTELVTTFGHGRHTCPAQPFSLSTMTAAVIRLLEEYHFVPGWVRHPSPVRAQIGGVARSADPCPLRYRRREGWSVA
jgi:cytochrome P450